MEKMFKDMAQSDSLGGVLLLVAAVLAMILANSPLQQFYQSFLDAPVIIQVGAFSIAKPLVLWINDGLMAIFFFMVGLEIKREIFQGHLSDYSQIVLPGIAAVAGIVFPALIYWQFNQDNPVALNGWAIPSATDIAFALGIFSLFGRHLPLALKLFLLSVAIFDDIGAIVIIALFYSTELSALSLAVAGVGLLGLFFANRLRVRRQAVYIVMGVVVWAAVLKSGVHATLAGFLVAWFIPLTLKNEDGHAMLPNLEHALHYWVAFLILPLFAFANAGVSLLGAGVEVLLNPVALGIAAGLFIGKQAGIFISCYAAVKLGLARLPTDVSWLQMYAASLLCGIGFTMSLFIGTLAFEFEGTEYLTSVKLGVLVGSLMSAILGAMIIRISASRRPAVS